MTPKCMMDMAELQQAGLVELMLLKADWSGAVLLLRTADLAAAREAVGSLPLVTNGITSFELTEVITASGPDGAPAPQPASGHEDPLIVADDLH
jgi:hypothetical protein